MLLASGFPSEYSNVRTLTVTDDSKTPEEEPKDTDSAGEQTPPEKTEPAKADASATTTAPDSDPLPEMEERTAEYVEEEAQRGDFVLRWAIVLLAMMLGFSQTDNSRALVHAKAGEYMQANGFLPPGKDVFSYTLEGQPWVQQSWLFDHVSAFAVSIAGPAGFTILTALFAAIAFGYAVHTAMPKVSSWWTVICVAFALLTCFPRFTPTPEILTLVFTAITLSWMYRWQTTDEAGFPWKIPVLFVVWANCDPRMWIGVALVGLYAIGHAIDRAIGRNGWTLPGKSMQVFVLFGACVVAALANPFIHKSLMQPVSQYGSEYPAMRGYTNLREVTAAAAPEWALQPYGLLKSEVWKARQKTTIAGAIILLVSIVLFIVNVKNLDLGYLLVLLGFATLTALACHELAVASLVAAVLAGLNGQDWYRHNFRTDYTTDVKSFVFSQGGRAVTVIGLFGFAFLGVSGRLTGPDGVRIGTGLDPNLAATVDGMEQTLEGIDKDSRLFNFTQSQGDALIWLGYKSFLDSRYELFGNEDGGVSMNHRNTRTAFRKKRTGRPGTGNRSVWQKTLKDYEVDYVAPRLYGRSPDYLTYFDLQQASDLNDPDRRWSLEKLGSSIALFKPRKLGDAPGGVDFRKLGLQTQTKEPPKRLDWAREPSFYDEYIFMPKRVRHQDSQLTQHYRQHLHFLPGEQQAVIKDPDQLVGLCYLTIRSANAALAISPNDARAYRAMGDAYSMLQNIESQFANQFQGTAPAALRARQSLGAYRQSLKADPKQADLMFDLYRIYLQQGQTELAVQMMDGYLEIVDTGDDLTEEEIGPVEAISRQRNALRDQVAQAIKAVTERREVFKKQNMPEGAESDVVMVNAELVQFCAQIVNPQAGGLTLHAQGVLEEGLASIQGSPQAMLIYGQLLMSNGELEESSSLFQQLSELHKQKPEATEDLNWESGAATIAMIEGEYERAREILDEQFVRLRSVVTNESIDIEKMQHLPLLGFPDTWPSRQAAMLKPLLVDAPGLAASVRFNIALTLIEEGRVNAGAELIRQLINDAPASAIAPLARYYYRLIKDKEIKHEFDAGYMPLDFDAEGDAAENKEEGQPNEVPVGAADGQADAKANEVK